MDHTAGQKQEGTSLFTCRVYSDQVIMLVAPVRKVDHGALLTSATAKVSPIYNNCVA